MAGKLEVGFRFCLSTPGEGLEDLNLFASWLSFSLALFSSLGSEQEPGSKVWRHPKLPDRGCVHVSQAPIQTPVLDRFADAAPFNFLGACPIGDGAADVQNSTVRSGAQAQLVDPRLKQLLRIIIGKYTAHPSR